MLAFSKCHIESRGTFRKQVKSWGRDSAPSSSVLREIIVVILKSNCLKYN